MMICRIDMSAKVYVKQYGMTDIVGSIVHFPKDVQMVVDRLPRNPDSLAIYVICKKKDPVLHLESGPEHQDND